LLSRGQLEALASRTASWELHKKGHGTTKAAATSTVFLSHSHRDQDIVAAAGLFLNDFGVSIYVDWKDNTMPTVTSPVLGVILGPGRPGWLPTQAPHRSRRAR